MKKRAFFIFTTILLVIVYTALGLFAFAQDEDAPAPEVLPLNGA